MKCNTLQRMLMEHIHEITGTNVLTGCIEGVLRVFSNKCIHYLYSHLIVFCTINIYTVHYQ